MDEVELNHRMAHGEDLHTEFKLWPLHVNCLAETLVAFANTDGGQLLLGVDDAGEATGVEDPDQTMRTVDNVAYHNCEPALTIWQETVTHASGATIVVVNIPKGINVLIAPIQAAIPYGRHQVASRIIEAISSRTVRRDRGIIMSQPMDTTLEKFVDYLTRGFTPELAKHFAELPTPLPELQGRLDELAEKANEGQLSSEETREYNKYIEYMDFVALLRLKARFYASTAPNV